MSLQKSKDNPIAVAISQHIESRAIEKAVAEYFSVAPSRVRIISGQTAKEKVIEVL